MPGRHREWAAALFVLVLTLVAVGLDIGDGSVRQFWSRHPFTSSVVAGVLVLLLTVLIFDRVNRIRQITAQSRAIGVQAAVIVAQAERAAGAITRPFDSQKDRDEASQELRTYMQMLLTSAPVLIDARTSRAFLEVAQQTAAKLYRAMRETADGGDEDVAARIKNAVDQLHQGAAPLLEQLDREQLGAVDSDEADRL